MKEWIKDILIAGVIAAVVVTFIKPTIVKEHSMEPNVNENDYLFISKQSYKLFGEPKRGDIVVVHSALVQNNGEEKMLIKRIIGLPGERLDILDGEVYINGEKLDESYTKEGYTNGDIRNLVIADDEIFCMGDNRKASLDSRSPEIGCVDVDAIVGKAVFRLYPFNQIGTLKNPYA